MTWGCRGVPACGMRARALHISMMGTYFMELSEDGTKGWADAAAATFELLRHRDCSEVPKPEWWNDEALMALSVRVGGGVGARHAPNVRHASVRADWRCPHQGSLERGAPAHGSGDQGGGRVVPAWRDGEGWWRTPWRISKITNSTRAGATRLRTRCSPRRRLRRRRPVLRLGPKRRRPVLRPRSRRRRP